MVVGYGSVSVFILDDKDNSGDNAIINFDMFTYRPNTAEEVEDENGVIDQYLYSDDVKPDVPGSAVPSQARAHLRGMGIGVPD